MYEKYKLMFGMLLIFLLVGTATAEQQTLGTVKQGESISLIQNCLSSSYSNISRIVYPNKSLALNTQTAMTKNGDDYNYTFDDTNELGQYIVYGVCDDEGIKTNWVYDFEVTGNGKEKPEGIIVVVFTGIFLFILFGSLFSLLKMIGHWVDLEVDILDASSAIGLYMVVFAFYYLSLTYLGDPTLEGLLLIAVRVGAITHVFTPIVAFATSLIFNPMRKGDRQHG